MLALLGFINSYSRGLGRTPGGSLVSRARALVKQSDAFNRARDLLVSGPSIVQLRSQQEIDQGALFGDQSYLAVDPEREARLSAVSGVGFEAAPPDPSDAPERLDELIRRPRCR